MTDALARWDDAWRPIEHRRGFRPTEGMKVAFSDPEGRPVTLEVARISRVPFRFSTPPA
jgi:hypothetical protein